jgi:osmotically-inducible protein OsmY
MKTDKELYDDVKYKLSFQPNLKVEHIAFSVHEGMVTLGGAVTTYNQKKAVERGIRRVKGVKGIANEIKVECLPEHKRNDVDIVAAAVNALNSDATVPSENIKVIVEDGWLTLSGHVQWYFEKKNAELCVNNLYGIKGVINHIQIQPSVTPNEVKNKIMEEFKRNAMIDAKGIDIEVHGGAVTLKGAVRNWSEMEEAVDATWAIPGVSQIDNQLAILA